MKYEYLRKCIIFGIIFLFIGACVLPNISSKQIMKNRILPFSISDPPVYQPTPDWISSSPHYSTGAALADFNKDGWLDLIVADGNDMAVGRVNIYYNNGDGTLSTTADWQSDDTGYNGHLDVADVNGDGWPDVAVSYLGKVSIVGPIARVYLNNEGVLSYLPDWTSDIIGNAFSVDFGDMNNDGRPDLAVATGWCYNPPILYHNYVYLNIDGTLESSPSWVSDDSNNYMGVIWIDADDDNWMDLAFISDEQETQIYRNLGGILETTASWQTSDSSTQFGIMLTAGDVTHDGIPDLFTTDNTQLGGSGLFKQYTGVEEGFFETTFSWSYYEGYGSAVALADVNGDKKLDLATGAWWDYTRIFLNDGTGIPTNPTWNSGGTSVVEKILFGNIGPTLCSRTKTEHFYPDSDQKLFYLTRQQIQYIESVYCDNELLDPSEYTYSREHGWFTINTVPLDSIKVVYSYSPSLDMVVSNWDPGIGNYLYYNQLKYADLDCVGNLVWIEIEPGENVQASFNVTNIGDTDSKLDWEIVSFPDWGEWTFNPEYGEDLTPEDGPVVVSVELTAPLKVNTEFLGEIKIVNNNDLNDYYIIQVSLITIGPDVECDGNLFWNDVKPGSKVQSSFSVKNIGHAGSFLDWRINSTPEWGIWTFSPESGDDLTPEAGPIIVNVEVLAPNEKNEEFTGKVTVINTLDPDDFCEIDIILNTPKYKTFKINLLFQQLLSYFPNLITIFNKFYQFLRLVI